MRKTTITVTYDEEKYSAMKLYLDQKGVSIEDELTKHLEALYNKTVPAVVREYFDLRAGKADPVPVKGRRTKTLAVEAESETEVKKDV